MITKEFIAEAKKVHGNKYDYSKVNYVNAQTKVIITCPQHGDFEQTPSAHLQGQGCPKCNSDKKKMTTEDFIAEAIKIHKNEDGSPKYDYDKVNYVNSKTKVTITCPIHGDFEQTPSAHLQGQGCLECSGKKKMTI